MPPSPPSPARPRKGKGDAPAKTTGGRGTRPSSGRVTLEDVAKLAGVSSMTVSRVLNRPDSVTPETVEVVRRAIAQTGYVPNLLAGGLASSRTRLVAAIVPSIATLIFSGCIQALTDRLAAEGYQMLLGLSGYNIGEREPDLLRAILSRRPDALFLTGTTHAAESRRQLRAAKIPIVETWDLSPRPIDMVVGFSHEKIGRETAAYLYGKGYRRFAAVSADDERAVIRRNGFVAGLADIGVSDVASIVTPAPTTLSMGRNALATLLDGGFSGGAVFCSSDALAHGVLMEAQARGLSVPGDVAVVGFGDLDFAASTFPALTTVRIDRFGIGRLAAELLLARLADREVEQKIVDVGFEIVERAST